MSDKPVLFQPTRVGRMDLRTHIVHAPLTRSRANSDNIPTDMMIEYYARRATIPGTFIMSEATFPTIRDTGTIYRQGPGMWNSTQAAAWKKIVDAVHARKSYIWMQLLSPGRFNIPEYLALKDPSIPYISAGSTPLPGWSKKPQVMTKKDIEDFIEYFASAAGRAVHEAGFDGVQVNGMFLLEEFLKNISNDRTDEYGFQTVENASRFALEVLEAVISRVGSPDRVSLKLNPWTRLKDLDNGVKPVDPKPVYGYLAEEVRRRWPTLAFLHVVEPRIEGDDDAKVIEAEQSNDFLREIWKGLPIASDGGYNRDTALERAEKGNHELIVFGRLHTSNPDLPLRLEHNIPLTPYHRPSFYISESQEGYNTFKFAEESKKILIAQGIDVTGA